MTNNHIVHPQVISDMAIPFNELVILQFRYSELSFYHFSGFKIAARSVPQFAGFLVLMQFGNKLFGY